MRRNNLTGSKQQHNTAHLEASGKQAQSGCSPFLNTNSSWTGLYGFPKSPCGSPYRDYSLFGSILKSPYFETLAYRLNNGAAGLFGTRPSSS